MQPLISVIMPVYNVEKCIEECFESIVQQLSNADMEIICVDDGSTDASGAICDRYAKENPKIKVIHHQTNRGVSAARNTGLDVAAGRYIAWIDPDDYVAGDWYKQISAALAADESIDILFFDNVRFGRNGKIAYKYGEHSRIVPQNEFVYEVSCERKINSQLTQLVLRRPLFDGVRFPGTVSYGEDYAVVTKILIKAERIYYLAWILYFVRERDGSICAKAGIAEQYHTHLMARERYEFLKKHGFAPSVTGSLLKAWGVCVMYHRSDAAARAAHGV